jgi:hypothetical protein
MYPHAIAYVRRGSIVGIWQMSDESRSGIELHQSDGVGHERFERILETSAVDHSRDQHPKRARLAPGDLASRIVGAQGAGRPKGPLARPTKRHHEASGGRPLVEGRIELVDGERQSFDHVSPAPRSMRLSPLTSTSLSSRPPLGAPRDRHEVAVPARGFDPSRSSAPVTIDRRRYWRGIRHL